MPGKNLPPFLQKMNQGPPQGSQSPGAENSADKKGDKQMIQGAIARRMAKFKGGKKG